MPIRRCDFTPSRYPILPLVCVLMAVQSAMAQDGLADTRVVVGVLAHDRGPASDRHENGTDLSGEVQFAPLDGAIGRAIGSPRPHVGGTLNLNGDTSTLYGGLTYEFVPHPQWFIDGFVGLAAHNGPLHKDPAGCAQRSDCGFGARVLPRFGVEAGFNFTRQDAVTVFYDHMSHGNLFNVENEGIDHVGLRFMHAF